MINSVLGFNKIFEVMAEGENVKKQFESLFSEFTELTEGIAKKKESDIGLRDLERFVTALQSLTSRMQSAIRKIKGI